MTGFCDYIRKKKQDHRKVKKDGHYLTVEKSGKILGHVVFKLPQIMLNTEKKISD